MIADQKTVQTRRFPPPPPLLTLHSFSLSFSEKGEKLWKVLVRESYAKMSLYRLDVA